MVEVGLVLFRQGSIDLIVLWVGVLCFRLLQFCIWSFGGRITGLFCSDRSLPHEASGKGQRNRFHFEDCWVDYPDCEAVIKQNWGAHGGAATLPIVLSIIHKCAASLHIWNALNLQHLRRRIANQR
ncbi:hypothetical protein ACOSQ4_017574 [Xanthoceras sorbifolium]